MTIRTVQHVIRYQALKAHEAAGLLTESYYITEGGPDDDMDIFK